MKSIPKQQYVFGLLSIVMIVM